MNIQDLLDSARELGASDVHLSSGRPPIFRIDGSLVESGFTLTDSEKDALILSMLGETQKTHLEKGVDIDFCYSFGSDGLRHRVNVYRQQNKITASIRIINSAVPDFAQLGLPDALRSLADEPRGLILVTGPTGSGKSTTLAAMVDYINKSRACHILTVEDPVEYLYKPDKALIHQRGLGTDVPSFPVALKSAMREDPDVILIGEMRDYETISAAVTAAETGHLVLSTLHTTGAAMTVDRIIDVFPTHSQQQIRTQLAGVLRGVVTQTLVRKASGKGRTAAFEIMLGTDAVLNMIRENKAHQLNSAIQTGGRQGMILMDSYLANLVKSGVITKGAALEKASNKSEFLSSIGRI